MHKIQFILLLAFMLGLNSCGVYNKYQRPELASDEWTAPSEEPQDSLPQWQTLFTDAHLKELIELGLESNTNLNTALHNIERAQIALRVSRLAYAPSLGVGAQGTISSFDQGKATQGYQLALNSSWEIDVFGKLYNAKQAKKAGLEGSKAYAAAVRTQLISTVACSYYALVNLDGQINITKRTLLNWKDYLRVMTALKNAGMTNQAAVSQAEANILAAENTLLALEQQVVVAQNSLNALLKRGNEPIERVSMDQVVVEKTAIAAIPLTAIRRRPDVESAEYAVAAGHYNVNGARAAMYPSLSLSGSAGWTNQAGAYIMNPGALIANAIGNLAQPIFNKGLNRAQLQLAKLDYEDALLQLEQTIINAGVEVNNALAAVQSAEAKLNNREKQIDALSQAVITTQKLMEHSNTSYLEVLTAQQGLLQAQLTECNEWLEYNQQIVKLFHALGGGVN
ncbi:MAG: efflux transporter outer membrane subunit [Marinifilaceae bacterium]